MAWSTTQLRWGRLLLVVLGAFAIASRFWPSSRVHYSIANSQRAWDDLAAIENQTLGVSARLAWMNDFLLTNRQFGKVFAINLPSRPDKRDNIVLGSSVCNFLVDWIDGVLAEQLNSKSYPYVRFQYARLLL